VALLEQFDLVAVMASLAFDHWSMAGQFCCWAAAEEQMFSLELLLLLAAAAAAAEGLVVEVVDVAVAVAVAGMNWQAPD
jgi:hypothetical protein